MTEGFSESAAPGGKELFDALCALEVRCRDNAAGLPQREAQSDIWAGVLFRIGEFSLLAPMEEVGEILEVPREITPVPGTKDWVFGIANNRGTLLPIFDLRGFLFASATSRSGRNRVLVVQREEFPVGLLVDDVTGIRHFDSKYQNQQVPELPDVLKPFSMGSFIRGAVSHPVFSVRRLTSAPEFSVTGA
ncbi:MAG: chemotaxis protein CheW [Chromatiaceae bacterium]|nr:chemotaxis protein CheW [Chromatiaceae bacterium]